MLTTEVPAPDPKCKLNILSFLSLPYLSDCFICNKETLIIVLLLQIMGNWKIGGWFIHVRVYMGRQRVCTIFLELLFCFCVVINCSWRIKHDSCWLFLYFCFAFFFSGPFN